MGKRGREVIEKRLRATLELNSGNFAKDFKNVNMLLKENQEEVKKTAKEIKAFGQNTSTLSNSFDALTKQYELQNAKAEIYRNGIEKSTKAYDANIEKRKQLSEALLQANKKYEEAVDLHGKESEAAKGAAEEVSKLQKEYDKTSKYIDTNEKALKRYNTGLRNTETELKLTKKSLEDTSVALEKSNNKWLQSAKVIEEYKKKGDALYNQVDSVGNAMIKGGALIAAGVTTGLKAYGEFGDSLAKVNSIAGLSSDALESLGKEIKQISNDLVIPINVLTDAEYEALSASVDVKDSMEFLATSGKLAKGGFTEVTKSVDVLTSVINAYGKETKEAAKISDILITTQNLGKVTVGQMADKLGEIIPTAKNAAVNIENLGTSIATVTMQGIKPAQAITYLNALFNEFSKSGTNVSKILRKETGKSFEQLSKEGKSVSDILLIIDKNSKKTGKTFNDLFGSVEAVKAAIALLKDEGTLYTKNLQEIEKSAGATQKAFEGVASTDMEKARKAMNELVNSFIKLGSSSAPILQEVSESITKLADTIESMDNETLSAIAQTGKWALILGVCTKGIGGLVKTGTEAVGVIGNMSKVVGTHGGLAGSLTTLAGGAKAAVLALNPLTIAATILGGGVIYAWAKATEVENERQEALNKTLKETQDILENGITPDNITSKELEISGLDAQIEDLHEFKDSLENARKERDALLYKVTGMENEIWSDATKAGKGYEEQIASMYTRIYELDTEINTLDFSVASLEQDLVRQNGTVADAEKKLKTYKQAIADAKLQKQLLSKATNEHTQAIADEYATIIKSIRQVEALTDEYDTLIRKEQLSNSEKQRLVEVQDKLIGTLGDSIAVRDEEGKVIGINTALVNKEKDAVLGSAAAYKRRTILAASAGIEHLKNVKNQVSKVIEAIKLEEEALAGRASWTDPRRIDTSKMNTAQRAYWETQKTYVKMNMTAVQGYESELDNLIKKLDTIEETSNFTEDDSKKKSKSDPLKDALELFEQRKKLNKVSIDNEMNELERIKEKYAKTTAEKISLDEYMLNNYLSILDRKKAAGEMYLDKEIQMLEIARDKYAITESTKVEIDNQINELKLENAKNFIDKKKYYNEMSLEDEKAAYERMLEYAKNNAEETEAINREIYRVQKEILEQEVEAVKKATQEKIKSRQEEKTEQMKLIDEKLARELEGYEAELAAIDKLEEAERKREKEEDHNKKIEDLQGKLTSATTDTERNSIIEQMNAENTSYEKYLKDQQRKEEREAIKEKMNNARKKAEIEKNLAEENYNNFVKGITSQEEVYIKFLENKGVKTTGAEQTITTFLQTEYANRNLLFKNAVDTDMAYLQGAALIMQGMYQSMFSLGGLGKLQLPSIPKLNSSGKTVNNTQSLSFSPIINNTFNVPSMATAKAVTVEQENSLNRQARNLGIRK